MTEHQWVDADEALEDAARREGAGEVVLYGRRQGWESEMSIDEVLEILEEAHSAGD